MSQRFQLYRIFQLVRLRRKRRNAHVPLVISLIMSTSVVFLLVILVLKVKVLLVILSRGVLVDSPQSLPGEAKRFDAYLGIIPKMPWKCTFDGGVGDYHCLAGDALLEHRCLTVPLLFTEDSFFYYDGPHVFHVNKVACEKLNHIITPSLGPRAGKVRFSLEDEFWVASGMSYRVSVPL